MITVEGNCKTCPCLCKRLGPDDEPAYYHFAKLTPVDVIDLFETIASEYQYWDLQIPKHQQSFGNQLALLFKAKRSSSRDRDLLVIVQASRTPSGTDLWLNYGVPEECCADTAMVKELSDMVQSTLEVLHCTDAMLAPRTSAIVEVPASGLRDAAHTGAAAAPPC